MSWSEFLIPLSGVVVGGGLSITAQWYVLKQQQRNWVSQQWWQRKYDAYTEVIENLWGLLHNSQKVEKIFADEDGDKIARSTIYFNEMFDHTKDVVKLIDVGAFVISDDAEKALHRLSGAFSVIEEDYSHLEIHEVLTQYQRVIRQCLADVRDAANRELKGSSL